MKKIRNTLDETSLKYTDTCLDIPQTEHFTKQKHDPTA